MKDRFYITTPIYYVNDIPHIGHAYTTIAADVLTRFHLALGKETFFLTGTDEHGQKVAQAAAKRGITPQEHCDSMVEPFQKLWDKLDIRYSKFIRTTQPDHKLVVQMALQKLYDKGLIEKRQYEGWYSTSSERFWMEKDLVNGNDPDTGLPVEWISESNYFFLMSRFQKPLITHLESHPTFIQPKNRYNEIMGFLRRELDDLCISRPKKRLSWGIELPFDKEFVTYVWFDALLNYLSGIGFMKEDNADMKFWPVNYHLIGKDILTTHSVYWISMLLALDVPLPQHIFAHGWWTVEGRKMSKSLQNVIDPNLLIDTYGPDPVRYFLLREVPFGNDGDFSHAAMIGRINADLGNDLGNALNRTVAMASRNFKGIIPQYDPSLISEEEETLKKKALSLRSRYAHLMGHEGSRANGESGETTLNFSVALESIWEFVRFINKYIDSRAPWKLASEGNIEELAVVIYYCLESLRIAAVHLAPFMPDKMKLLMETIGVALTYERKAHIPDQFFHDQADSWGLLKPGEKLRKGVILFPRIEPGDVEPILRQLFSLAQSQDEAEQMFHQIFPKIKPGKAKKWLHRLQGENNADSSTVNTTKDEKKKEKKKKEKKAFPEPAEEITFDEFCRIDLRVAEILDAERIPKSKKLLKLQLQIGDEQRQIVAGIGKAWTPEQLMGKKIIVVANLKPAKLMGETSRGMLLAAGFSDEQIPLCEVDPQTPSGTRVH